MSLPKRFGLPQLLTGFAGGVALVVILLFAGNQMSTDPRTADYHAERHSSAGAVAFAAVALGGLRNLELELAWRTYSPCSPNNAPGATRSSRRCEKSFRGAGTEAPGARSGWPTTGATTAATARAAWLARDEPGWRAPHHRGRIASPFLHPVPADRPCRTNESAADAAYQKATDEQLAQRRDFFCWWRLAGW
jgi:hypothetical protein